MAPARPGARVRSLAVETLDVPLLSPFGISGGSLGTARNALATVVLEDGTVGLGEAAPFPAYNGETQEGALGALRRAERWLPGWDCGDWRAVAAEFRSREGPGCGSSLCALETAMLDALAIRDGLPLWRFFGPGASELETDMTVTTGTPMEAGEAARAIRARGVRVIKVKVGGPGGAAADLERIAAVAEAAPGAPLILDANAGLSRAGASELVRGLRRAGIAPLLLEQWLPRDDLEGMRALGAESGWTVAADEAASSAADVRRIAESRAAQVVNVKLMKAGVSEALAVVEAARIAGIGLMIGGNVETVLSMTVSACFAVGLGGFSFADLDTPLFLASNPFVGGYRLRGGAVSVSHIEAGHGVRTPGLLL
jgi:L-alanine-DL-glutamate epimerase-like enolase superfamily enzyme